MPRGIAMTLLALGLAMGFVVPAHASITTTHKSSMKSLANTLIQQPDLMPSGQDIDTVRKRAQSGDAHAQMLLGGLYLFGANVPRDVDKGLHWLQLAADQGDHDGMALLGGYLVFMDGKKSSYDQGLVYLKKLAERGQPHDMAVYGIALLSSAGPPSNWTAGFAYLQKAAGKGDPNATLMLGMAYTTGHGVLWNPFKAVHWYQKALTYPLPKEMSRLAQYQLGVAYLGGQGIEKDVAKGATLIRKATEAGSPEAAYTLSVLYLDGMGVPKDAAKARQWLLIAAQAGSPDAQFVLGMNYTLRRKTDRDYKQGIPWLERAAHQGYARAYGVLGIMHRMGWGFPVDAHAAAKMWMRGAQLGDGASAYLLAQLWKSEHNKEGDVYAVMWLAIAKQLGYGDARHELSDLEKRFRQAYVQKGLIMAQAWFKLRAGQDALSPPRK